MDKYTKDSLNRIIDYIYDSEHKSYSELTPDEQKDHIFNDVDLVSGWLKNNE